MSNSYLIKNGTIYDGLGGDGFLGDILVQDGLIAKINPSIADYHKATTVIDAKGLWVMPGFIDIHTHYDAEIEIAPALSESVRHGVTTIVMGSCVKNKSEVNLITSLLRLNSSKKVTTSQKLNPISEGTIASNSSKAVLF